MNLHMKKSMNDSKLRVAFQKNVQFPIQIKKNEVNLYLLSGR